MSKFNLQEFQKSLSEAIIWCDYLVHLDNTSSVFWESMTSKTLVYSDLKDQHLDVLSFNERQKMFHHMVDLRKSLLHVGEITFSDNKSRNSGLLTAFFPDYSFNDATAESMTDGFYNFTSMPPPSTWVTYVYEDETEDTPHFICWIPPKYVEISVTTIESLPDESLQMIEDTKFKATYKAELERCQII